MTEEQARITQCCGPEGCGYFNDEPRPARWCVASDCMAWQEVGEWRIRSDRPWQSGKPHGDFVGPNNETRSAGYCGLAGQPS